MTKKYLILKNPVPKAGNGWESSTIAPKFNSEVGLYNIIGQFVNPMAAVNTDTSDSSTSENALNSMFSNGASGGATEAADDDKKNRLRGKGAGIIGMASGAAGEISDFAFDNALEKNSRTTGFGDEIFDEKDAKLETGKSTVSGLTKGAGTGAAIGSMIIPGWGTAVGAVVGGIAGAIGGLIKGKKSGKRQLSASSNLLNTKLMATARSEDMRNSAALLGKTGTKLGKISIPTEKSKALVMKKGGRLEMTAPRFEIPGEVNVVVKGKLHKENNNLGNKDKGIPVIDSEGKKEYEVEAGEVIFRQEITHLIEDYTKRYVETKDESLFEELGKILVPELLKNTQDNYGEFGVKLAEEAPKIPDVLVKKVDPMEKILADKPEFIVKLVSDKTLLDYDDPVEKRLLLKSIRKRYSELKDTFNNL